MAAARKLPVFDTAAAVFVFLWRERWTILRLSWFPLLVSLLAEHFATGAVAIEGVNFLTVASWAVIAVSLHRAILFGDRQPGTFLNIRFGKVEALFVIIPVLYLVIVLILEALTVPIEVHLKGNKAIVGWIVAAIVIFFIARLSLVFPIAVAERRVAFAQSWALTHGNVWRMIGVWFLVTIVAYVTYDVLEWLFRTALNLRSTVVAENALTPRPAIDIVALLRLLLLDYPFSIVIGALCVGILSFSYKTLAGFGADMVIRPEG